MMMNQTYWQMILKDLETAVLSSHFGAWFCNLELHKITNFGKTIILKVNNRFTQNYLETKYKEILLTSIQKFYPRVMIIEFELDTISKPKKPTKKNSTDSNEKSSKSYHKKNNLNETLEFGDNSSNDNSDFSKIDSTLSSVELVHLPKLKKNLHNLNSKYNFDNFIVTSCNELVATVAKTISANPGKQYNPVFIHAPVGLGKTHILNAIGHKTLELHPSFNIKYLTTEGFINHFISCVTSRRMSEFNAFYNDIDLLLVDDIQFIAGKEGTQEALFHIFNLLHQNNKQIVFASDRNPKAMGGIESRLVSRFEWGLVVDISKPNFEDRLSVIKYKIDQLGLKLSTEFIIEIANRVDTNYRDIEGVINRIKARIELLPGREFDVNDLSEILLGYNHTSLVQIDLNRDIVSPDQLFEVVADVLRVNKEVITSTSRDRQTLTARQIAMYLLKHDLKYTYASIGKIFNKNHATIMHSVDKIAKESATNHLIQKQFNMIRSCYKR
jgi:chromosomal replication initiator protein